MSLRGEQLRDQHGAARAIAYLTLAGAPYVLVTGVIWPTIPAAGIAAVVAAALFMTATGLICWLRPRILPHFFWYAAPVVATALVTALNVGTSDASTGAQLFYLWPVLYAANFLPRRHLYVNLALVFAGHAAVVLHVLGAAKGLSDWVAMTLAMTMTTIVVSSLRARADRLRADLEQQANADPLTGLNNRRSFTESLAAAGEWARATGGSLALISIDLDHFKTVNDTYGHAAGDAALQAVAEAMRTLTAGLDAPATSRLAARLGGDEFVLLLRLEPPDAPGAAGSYPDSPAVSLAGPAARLAAARSAETLRSLLAANRDLPGGPPSLSIGIATLPADVATIDELLIASDAALYEAKATGRGRTALAGPRQNVDAVPSAGPSAAAPSSAGPAVTALSSAGPSAAASSSAGPAVAASSSAGPSAAASSSAGPAVAASSSAGPAVAASSSAGPAVAASSAGSPAAAVPSASRARGPAPKEAAVSSIPPEDDASSSASPEGGASSSVLPEGGALSLVSPEREAVASASAEADAVTSVSRPDRSRRP
ncbi:GGDEF domain-containing protein [Actinoplanes sp. RD1]|uniref:GGDEF domain-containing protein n=1 Tax=Actinoplanes sp. RD1 TaxID=3064538 RepID=UPI0027427D8D|nr:GGDEF domain-containing protein [Actinoplanes sp. RD1]